MVNAVPRNIKITIEKQIADFLTVGIEKSMNKIESVINTGNIIHRYLA